MNELGVLINRILKVARRLHSLDWILTVAEDKFIATAILGWYAAEYVCQWQSLEELETFVDTLDLRNKLIDLAYQQYSTTKWSL